MSDVICPSSPLCACHILFWEIGYGKRWFKVSRNIAIMPTALTDQLIMYEILDQNAHLVSDMSGQNTHVSVEHSLDKVPLFSVPFRHGDKIKKPLI